MPVDPYVVSFAPLEGIGQGPRSVPREFRIFRRGDNETESGVYVFDDKAATQVMEAWGRRQIDLTMDYEHQALHEPPIEAPAACTRWVPQVRDGDLWATDCMWTDKAWMYLANGEYRYISPAFRFDEKSMRIREVINLALTNLPAMRGIAPLVAATQGKDRKEPGMNYEQMFKDLQAKYDQLQAQLNAKDGEIAQLNAKLAGKAEPTAEAKAATEEIAGITATLSLPATAGRAERTTAVTSLAGLRASLRGVTGAADDAAAIGIIHGWKQASTETAKLSQRIAELEGAQLTAEFEGILDKAGTEGKLTPAKREELKTAALKMSGGKLTADGITFVRAALSVARATHTGSIVQDQTIGPGDLLDPTHAHIRQVLGRKPETPSGAAK